ncbi:MAG: prepilin-type N-terminal cleavage/methylation domain-containing protein [Gemmatimonadaceae bacterium]
MSRRLTTAPSPAEGRWSGFSLIEVIVATSLLAIVMMLLASLSLAVGRRGRMNDLMTKRNFAIAQQADRIQAMPIEDVALLASGSAQVLVGDFTFQRRLTVTKTGSTRYTIKIVVAPVAGEFGADSVTIDRTRPASGTPLCTTC